ncbi:hypothetical protein AHF37_05638 [Paragonimus kellicotti]|nr:hypothetical protein AHF37_05638 [Paragonimus kellicotti]
MLLKLSAFFFLPTHHRFIMQIFTSALFERDAFFMELIQRYAEASGFGAGNITALWLAVEAALNADRRRANRSPST